MKNMDSKLTVVAQVCNPSIQEAEAEAEGSLLKRQLELHSEL